MQRKYIYIRFIGSEISWPVSFPIFQIFQLPWQLYTYIWWAEGGCLELVGNHSHINKVFHKAFNKVVYKVFYNSSWQMWCHGSFVLLRCWFSFFYFDFRIPSTVHTKSSCGLYIWWQFMAISVLLVAKWRQKYRHFCKQS